MKRRRKGEPDKTGIRAGSAARKRGSEEEEEAVSGGRQTGMLAKVMRYKSFLSLLGVLYRHLRQYQHTFEYIFRLQSAKRVSVRCWKR